MFRADRVYRTGVIPPLVEVNPGPNVQAVAQAFTAYGSSLQLDGPLSFWQRWKLKRAARKASKRTLKMIENLVQQPPQANTPTMAGLYGPAPSQLRMQNMANSIANGRITLPDGARTYLQAGAQIVPQGYDLPMQLAVEATAKSPPEIARAGAATGIRNWINPRRGRFDRRG